LDTSLTGDDEESNARWQAGSFRNVQDYTCEYSEDDIHTGFGNKNVKKYELIYFKKRKKVIWMTMEHPHYSLIWIRPKLSQKRTILMMTRTYFVHGLKFHPTKSHIWI
jgi:hypothetical protein